MTVRAISPYASVKYNTVTVAPEMRKIKRAVMNHPPITVRTPEILYGAHSRVQALSASDVPIATMKVTYVVERGSFFDVANEITAAAIIKFTEALRRSKAAPSPLWSWFLAHLEAIAALPLFGIIFEKVL